MPLPTVGTAAGVHKPHLAADSRHLPAAGPATQPPWTQGSSVCHCYVGRH